MSDARPKGQAGNRPARTVDARSNASETHRNFKRNRTSEYRSANAGSVDTPFRVGILTLDADRIDYRPVASIDCALTLMRQIFHRNAERSAPSRLRSVFVHQWHESDRCWLLLGNLSAPEPDSVSAPAT